MWRKVLLVLLLSLLSVVLLVSQDAISSVPSLPLNSTQTSSTLENLWQTLLSSTSDLPTLFSNYQSDLSKQIASLQANNLLLTNSNQGLSLSNRRLINSNQLLITSNTSLMESLKQSQVQVTTLADDSQRLKRDLVSSTKDIIDAQKQAALLEARIGALKITCIGLGGVLAVGCVYEGGHIAKWW